MIYVFILIVGLIAGTLGGIVGTGTSIMLLPVLAYSFGPKQAVPIMAIAAIMANLARIMAWWRDVDWRAVIVYSVPGIPAAALGAGTLLVLPSGFVDIAIGVFFILMIPFRRWMHAHQFTLPLWSLAIVGAGMGYLTGIVASTGPMTVPIFVSYGLIRGPLLGTEAASSLAVYISKAITFQRLDALPPDVIFKGLIAGSSLFAGAFIAKRVVLRLDAMAFHILIEGLMLIAGLSMIWGAFQG
ncbi:MAG: hypothetical protein BGN84_01120 [Afipia sp. 62-7]|nr:sulfite exporter TauE/SafE family protein [Afipia sp.]OJU19115.1 MAG: hypothetical protein BGN84_01120 [Afipia sp. 62-7]